MQTFKIFFSKTTPVLDRILRYYFSPWVCVIQICSNGGTIYIISELIAKDNVNTENLRQTFKNLLLQNYSTTKFLDICT